MMFEKKGKAVSVDMRDEADNITLLDIACENHRVGCARYLLEIGADMLVHDFQSRHCIDYAILTGDARLVKFLCYLLTFKLSNGKDILKFLNIDRMIEETRNLGFHSLVSFLQIFGSSLKNGSIQMVRDLISDNNRSRDKIESKCWNLIEQRKCNDLFLSYLGCGNSSSSNVVSNNNSYKDFKFEIKSALDSNNARKIMNGIVLAVFEIINKKLPISDDLIMLCFTFLKMTNNENKMVSLLKQVVRSALSIDNPRKKRDGLYFKRFLLESNVWFSTFNNGILLFDEIETTVNQELEKQQKFLKESFLASDKKERQHWRNVLNYKEWMDKTMSSPSGLRQDNIPNGIVSKFSANELFTNDLTGFDGKEMYDLNSYLTELLITSQALNGQFQKDAARLVIDKNSVGCGTYAAGPVKLAKRCQIKAQTDYAQKPWPATSQIVDLIRCSYTFNTCKEMYEAMTRFEKYIKQGKGGSIKRILRVKNMFSQYKAFHDKFATLALPKFSYCDIKFNVLISYGEKSIIGEMQFLLKFMDTAKHIGHSLYGIVRRREFVDNVTSMMNDVDRKKIDSSKYTSDLKHIIIKKDYTKLCNQVLYHGDSLMLDNDENKPLLCNFINAEWNAAVKLYYATLLHFDAKYNLNGKFVTQYINQDSVRQTKHKQIVNSKFYRK